MSTAAIFVSADRPYSPSTRVTLDEDRVKDFEDYRLEFDRGLLRGISSHGYEIPNSLQEVCVLPMLSHAKSAEMRAILLSQNERLAFYCEEMCCVNFERFYPACATAGASSIVFLSSAPQLGRFRISLSSGWAPSHGENGDAGEYSTIQFGGDVGKRRWGNDVILDGSTGCGKTSALVLSMLRNLDTRKNVGVQAIYICPTREVTAHTFRMISSLSKFVRPPVSVHMSIGGGRIRSDIEVLAEDQTQVLVGTPGRVKFLLEFFDEKEDALRLKNFHMLIIDELDDLLSRGFDDHLAEISGFLRERTEGFQTCLSTKNWTLSRRFCREYTTDLIRITRCCLGDL